MYIPNGSLRASSSIFEEGWPFCLKERLLITAQSTHEYQYRSDICHSSFDNISDAVYGSDDDYYLLKLKNDETIDEDIVARLDTEDINVYCLYTRENPRIEDILIYNDTNSIHNSKFNSSKVTVFIIHGWLGNRKSIINTLLTKASLQDSDVNVIVVDWGALAGKNYVTAALSVHGVGKHIGVFIKWLATLGLSYEKVHIIGHSLGAHVAGAAGNNTDDIIKRITGLDPAGPLWAVLSYRLTKIDAHYVEVIHTNTKCLGYKGLLGHADFFPNGGERMPGCYISACSHSKSYYYMADTILNKTIYTGARCSNMDEVHLDNCKGELYSMGNNDLTKNRSGIYRVSTDKVHRVPLPIITRRFLLSEDMTWMECELFHDIWNLYNDSK